MGTMLEMMVTQLIMTVVLQLAQLKLAFAVTKKAVKISAETVSEEEAPKTVMTAT